jgi:hypothetical protein
VRQRDKGDLHDVPLTWLQSQKRYSFFALIVVAAFDIEMNKSLWRLTEHSHATVKIKGDANAKPPTSTDWQGVYQEEAKGRGGEDHRHRAPALLARRVSE